MKREDEKMKRRRMGVGAAKNAGTSRNKNQDNFTRTCFLFIPFRLVKENPNVKEEMCGSGALPGLLCP